METITERYWRELAMSDEGWPATIIIDGVDAEMVARAIVAAGGPALVNDADPIAVLTGPGYTEDPNHLSEVPDGFADLLIARWSWDGPADLIAFFEHAARILKPGGRLLAMEPDDEMLMGSTPHRYPFRLVPDVVPDLLERRGRRTVGRAALAAALTRGEFEDDTLREVQEPRGHYETAAELWEAAAGGAWPMLGVLGDEREPVMEQVGTAMRSLLHGPVADDRPWLAAAGLRR